jgi:hypothetical protein
VQPARRIALARQRQQSRRRHRAGRSWGRGWSGSRRGCGRGRRGIRGRRLRRVCRLRRIAGSGRRIRLWGCGCIAGRRIALRIRAWILRIRRGGIARRICAVGRRGRRGLGRAGVTRARSHDEERRPQRDHHGGSTHGISSNSRIEPRERGASIRSLLFASLGHSRRTGPWGRRVPPASLTNSIQTERKP